MWLVWGAIVCFLSVERRIVTWNDKNKKVKKGLTVGIGVLY